MHTSVPIYYHTAILKSPVEKLAYFYLLIEVFTYSSLTGSKFVAR